MTATVGRDDEAAEFDNDNVARVDDPRELGIARVEIAPRSLRPPGRAIGNARAVASRPPFTTSRMSPLRTALRFVRLHPLSCAALACVALALTPAPARALDVAPSPVELVASPVAAIVLAILAVVAGIWYFRRRGR